jgi:protein SCO1/2
VQLAEGGSLLLPKLFQGRVTAVQLMFTTCNSTCPMQGAAFGALAARLRGPGWQLLSLSIDALGDTPQRLIAWQRPFGTHAQWRLGLPAVVDAEHLRDFFQGSAGRAGTHTSQVFLVDAQARLAWRSGDSPELAVVAAAMNVVARQG